jgi:membrane protein YqaA with SNARE-associated domain
MKIAPAKIVHAKAAPQATLIAAASIWTTLRRWGGPGLLLIGIVDASFIPTLGSLDIFNALLAARHHDLWWYYALMSTAGSVIGAYLMYRAAGSAGTGWLQKRLGAARVARVDRLLERYGVTAVVIAVIAPPPFPSSAFFMAAGALKFPMRKYLAAVIAGRAFRYSLVAWIASHYSSRIIRVFRHPQQYLATTISITVALVLVAVAAGLTWHRIGQEIERAQAEAAGKQQAPSC